MVLVNLKHAVSALTRTCVIDLLAYVSSIQANKLYVGGLVLAEAAVTIQENNLGEPDPL